MALCEAKESICLSWPIAHNLSSFKTCPNKVEGQLYCRDLQLLPIDNPEDRYTSTRDRLHASGLASHERNGLLGDDPTTCWACKVYSPDPLLLMDFQLPQQAAFTGLQCLTQV